MENDHWQLIQTLFNQAVELDAVERDKYLRSLSHHPKEVLDDLNGLLEADNQYADDELQHDVATLSEESQFPKIKGFHIKNLIAHGGMGSVYLAFDLTLSREVAIKVLHPHLAQQEKFRQRFLQEARAAARVQHDHINTIYDVVQNENNDVFIISAYCEGVDLATQIENRCLDIELIIRMMRQLASALQAAHAQGIIHRDLKPDNILIDGNGVIKLVDFGIAKIRDEHQTSTGEIIGTPAYMSPEQFRGESVDASSDIWAFGVLLYQLLEGRTPYPQATVAEIIYSILHEPIKYHEQQSARLSPLYDIIKGCLQVDKSNRYRQIDQVHHILLQAQVQLKGSDHFNELPDYKSNLKNENIETIPTIQSSRDIFLVYFVQVDTLESQSKMNLSSWVKKYQGQLVIESNSTESLNGVSRAYFGYPLANDLTLKNALSCGLQWLKLKIDKGLSAQVYVEKQTLLDEVSSYSLDPSLLNNLDETQLKSLKQRTTGLYVSRPLLSSIPDHFSPIQQDLDDQSKKCIQLEQIQTELYKPFSLKLSPFTGRDAQLAVLKEHWQQVLEGDVQRVLISGEAGIGKSRLINEFKQPIIESDNVHYIELACSPYEINTPFYPFLNYLRQQHFASLKVEDAEHNHDLIRQFIKTLPENNELDFILLCQLLGEPLSDHEVAQLPIGDLLNRHIRDLLVRIIANNSVEQKSLFIVEDLHWIDPASDQLIEQLLQLSARSDTLTLLSCRPEYKPNWLSNVTTSNLYLSPLRASQSEALLFNLLGQNTQRDFAQLASRSGGNPLFIEELAKSVEGYQLESNQEVPETIQSALLGRLDRIGSAKHLAQIASAIGRYFNLVLLKQCLNLSDNDFEAQFNSLIQADIIYASNDPNIWYFKHALIRDAVYQSLEKTSQQQLHASIASNLESYHVLIITSQPSLIAMHWELGNNAKKSAYYWQLSAQRNLTLFAITECIDECHHALGLIESLETTVKEPLELSLRTVLGPALMNRYGYADDKVGEAYERALELIDKLNMNEQRIQIMFGNWTYLCVRAEHMKAFKLSMKMIDISLKTGNKDEICESYMVQGINDFYRGDFVTAQKHLNLAIDYYDHDHSLQHIITYGQNPFVATTNFRAWNELALGNIEQAIIYAQETVALARETDHPLTLVYGLSYATYVWMSVGDFKQAEALVLESIQVSEENEVYLFLGLSLVLYALLLFNKGEIALGEQAIQKANDVYLPTGAKVMIPNFYAVQAEVLMKAQRLDEAEELVNQALDILDQTKEHWCLTPVLALKMTLHFLKNEQQQGLEQMQKLSNVLDAQKAEGLRQMFIQKGIDFSVLG